MRWIDGLPIGRNDSCRCGSGFKLKKCCIQLVTDPNVAHSPDYAVYLTYSDLWPSPHVTLQDVCSVLADLNAKEVVSALCRFGVLLEKEFQSKTPKYEPKLLASLLDDVHRRKVALWLQSGRRHKVLTRGLLLAAIQLVMTAPTSAAQKRPLAENRHELGRALLMLTNLVDVGYLQLHTAAATEATARDTTLASLYRAGFYEHEWDLASAMGRHWALLSRAPLEARAKYPSEYMDIAAEFQAAFEIPLERMLGFGVGIWYHFESSTERMLLDPNAVSLGPAYFQLLTPAARDSTQRVLEFLSLSWEDYCGRMARALPRPNFDQLFEFYNHPMVALAPDVCMPIDMRFLQTAVTEGIYWRLFGHFQTARERRAMETLRSFFGRAFEWYTHEIIAAAFDGQPECRVWLDWRNDFPATKGRSIPDAVVVEGDTAFVLEFTTSSLTPSESVSNDPTVLRNGLRKIWFGRGREQQSAKLIQLFEAASDLRDGSLRLSGFRPEAVRTVVPILVSLRHFPQNQFLLPWYKALLRAEGSLLSDEFIDQLMFWNIDELERMAALRTKGRAWTQVLHDRRLSRQYAEESLALYLASDPSGVERNALVERWREEAFECLLRDLFGASLPAEPALEDE